MRPQPDKQTLSNHLILFFMSSSIFSLSPLAPPNHPLFHQCACLALTFLLHPTRSHYSLHISLSRVCVGKYRVNLGEWLRGMSDHICANNAVIGNNRGYSSAGWTSVSAPQQDRAGNRKKNDIDVALKNQYRFGLNHNLDLNVRKFLGICCCEL